VSGKFLAAPSPGGKPAYIAGLALEGGAFRLKEEADLYFNILKI
jgi:hypothetical protein